MAATDRMLQLQVEGLQNLESTLEEHKDKSRKFVMFMGAIDETGESWCSDCRDAEPVVEKVLDNASNPADCVFVLVVVGDRACWKDPNNEFRQHPSYALTGIPTLIEVGTNKRLGPDDCKKQDLVEMLFED
ncbi:thioredoxin domain-containing protein 17 [Exaiptasia diaphana]|uniref:Thioredoxin domain-containing protein 17 n=1 Tax=Exaiptasia diaphana TaxID=2652724 RepID=A0A913WT81_EXADI|nr:thioredoxin domain-containing protein 17 [Exaiptasia diaphana]KXJ27929.1 Thioredoxin domain-containing protein 17 [Exaiptasia diaphana]